MSNLSAKHFHSEAAAFAYVEARVWPEGPVCPFCAADGVVSRSIKPMKGKTTRPGLYKCYESNCRKPFTVRIGTIFERSHVPLNVWLQAMFLMASSKKGISANQISRTLSVTLKTAWFLMHRIRLAMATGSLNPFGMNGETVEVDETFIGNDPDAPRPTTQTKARTINQMMKVVSLVERESGRARSFVVDRYTVQDIVPIVEANLAREAHLRTDESRLYKAMGTYYASHETTVHSKGEYVRLSDRTIHTNTVEGFFSIFKRGMKGVYQHCAKRHLHRYLAEFDFRYSNRVALGVSDIERADRILSGVVGKRLTYAATGGMA